MLHVLSCGQYEACTKAVPNMFGLSAASVSRRFIRASAQVLKVFSERRLERNGMIVLVLVGKGFA